MDNIEDMIAEIILLEMNNLAAASELSQNRDTLRQQAKKSDSQRNRENALQLQQDLRSTDPLIRKKATLQKQLAQVIKQIRQRNVKNMQATANKNADELAGEIGNKMGGM